MFIDYIPLMLVNMAAGLVVLASFLAKGLGSNDEKMWASGFFMTGVIALISGFFMSFTWPLPGSYNVAFGEMSVLFGIVFIGAGFSLLLRWNLTSVAIYAFFAGIAAVIIGIRIINLKMTKEPLVSGLGFILTGLSGGFALAYLYLWRNKFVRFLAIAVILLAALIWLRTGYIAYWAHLSDLSQWKPVTMK